MKVPRHRCEVCNGKGKYWFRDDKGSRIVDCDYCYPDPAGEPRDGDKEHGTET